MSFPPIAIVGQGCVLPGALTPEQLRQAVLDGRDLLGRVPEGYWRLAPEKVLSRPDAWRPDSTWSDRGGYVRGFEGVFDPEGFAIPAEDILAFDAQLHWVLHAGRQALGGVRRASAGTRAGLVLGNLAYPTFALSDYAEAVWRQRSGRPHPRNRFHAGSLPHLAAAALGLGAGSAALDAACASSLYAVKLACDRLHDGTADLMLAGAVNRADDLLIHIGFAALQALSRSGRSRPFHREADGLVPAEGAALVGLKRLEDALRDGDAVLGVIRGVGLSNDGRRGGFLSPSKEGQVRAMRRAYEQAGLEPRTVSLLECHATGTAVGDGVEAQSIADVFAEAPDLPLGSLKSNLGHLTTAAGAAGLLKVLAAFAEGVRPPTLHADPVRDELRQRPLRVLHRPEPWEAAGPRRAAVSAFGFGGTNAHLIVEEHRARAWRAPTGTAPPPPRPAGEGTVAIVGLATQAGGADTRAFADLVLGDRPAGSVAARIEEVTLDAAAVVFPPRDLGDALPQHLLVLQTALAAAAGVRLPARETGVFVGMQCDAEVARRTARLRVADWAEREVEAPGQLPESWVSRAQDAFAGPTDAAVVIGAMPNIAANRLNVQLDLGGPGFTVSAEELSGIRALEVALRGLRVGELDAALVGAVDLCCEPVHEAAAAEVLPANRSRAGDAAVVLVLKRLEDARRDRDPIFALLPAPYAAAPEGALSLRLDDQSPGLAPLFGHAHAASGLLLVAAAALALRQRRTPVLCSPAGKSWPPGQGWAQVYVEGLGGEAASVLLCEAERGGAPATLPAPTPPTFSLRYPAHFPPVVLPPLPQCREGPARLIRSAARKQRQVFQGFLRCQQAAQGRMLRLRDDALQCLEPARRLRRSSVPRQEGEAPAEPSSPPARQEPRPPGALPAFTREQLEVLATGKVSEVFGPLFEQQDGYRRQVRLPAPPLLLVDRITGIDAEPGTAGRGTIWTETEVDARAWYLHHGVMPAGLMIEAGQADLTLISWMGADFCNRGERVYRLLGCDLCYHGGLAGPGETLRYDIHIDGHARQGDVRLFFFHYDCRVGDQLRMTVRNGQAGFFTDDELTESGGVLWSPESGEHSRPARLDAPALPCRRARFGPQQLDAYYQGRVADCFGVDYELLRTHTRTPVAGKPSLQLLDEVTDCDARGGPWGRGYLRARTAIGPSDWYFDGHFKDDPCMPGTLMFEGMLQAMAFYLTWLGYSLDKDGWRFEPVPEQSYRLRCRGQVTPASREMVCELFIEEVHGGAEPVLYADLLVTVDGLKAFHCRRMGLRLVPDWPLRPRTEPGSTASWLPADSRPFAVAGDVRGDQGALLACAWGRPSDAFGAMYRAFDGPRRAPRLPGPPYHFMSRITRIDAEQQAPRAGAAIEAEYDVPVEAWYFDAQGAMPFCVLLEANLQPCGWLATFLGFTLRGSEDVAFRNLDGSGTVLHSVRPGAGTLRTRVTLTRFTTLGELVIVSFETACSLGEEPVCRFETSFGFFSRAALARQVGLPPTPEERADFEAPSELRVELAGRPGRYFGGPLTITDGPGRMIDRITGYWPEGGKARLGRLRSEQTVDPASWYFKAHFYQDPVQAGSLGLEAMLQLLQVYMIERGVHAGIARPAFEPIALGQPLTWKYRGQVVPTNARVEVELEVREVGRDERGPYALAEAWLWVDGLRIYHAQGLGLRIVAGAEEAGAGEVSELILDPAVDRWLEDHRPTFTLPAAPLAWMADALAQAARRFRPDGQVLRIEGLRVERWLVCDRARKLQVTCRPLKVRNDDLEVEATLSAWREASRGELSRFEPVATARVVLGGAFPPAADPLPPLADAGETELPYASCAMFHGPAFRLLRRLAIGADGVTARLHAGGGAIPAGLLHPALLDGLWHGLTRSAVRHWLPELPEDVILLPAAIEEMSFFGPAPISGEVRCEVRRLGYQAEGRLAWFAVEMSQGGRLWMRARVAERPFPLGPFAPFSEAEIGAFQRGQFIAGLGLARREDTATRLSTALVKSMDWLPGTLAQVYRAAGNTRTLTWQIAVKEHLAHRLGVHPAEVVLDEAGDSAWCAARPGERLRVRVGFEGEECVVGD
jgi:3-oxoacyl-(acyl-carrier-protein) synthase/3-hydroxymyristoyl/3-hydroxydecanoyl-(acyl carrier protein) dehydratase